MRRSRIAAVVNLAWLALLAAPGHAQYKWQESNGGIVYSDLPPPMDARVMADRTGRRAAAADDSAEVALPFPLKSAKDKFPVTLYTAPDCAPCQSARDFLSQRGVPFAEKRIGSSADVDAYKSMGFVDAGLPALNVGRERSSGFEAGAWNALLDAAGYPKRSMLPPRYRQAEATPLAGPSSQKVEIVVREEPAAGDRTRPEVRPADPTAAIERYRQAMQEAAAAQRRAQQPDVRF